MKVAYDELCITNSDNLKEIHLKFVKLQKQNIRCINLLAKAKKKVLQEDATQIKETCAPKSGLHVQPCEVNIFDGDYSSWSTFRDLFTAIYINNNRLCGVEKLCYLFQKTSGDAREINRNIAIVEENFKIAWENLRSRYECSLINNYITYTA